MPRYIPPREALGEFMNSPSGLAFVREFLASNGAELLDDLLDSATLQYVGARWQEKLLAAFRKRMDSASASFDADVKHAAERFDFIDQ